MKPAAFEKAMKTAVRDLAQPTQMLTEIGLIAQGASQRLTPVATGTLRRSVTHRVEGNAVYIGTAVEYAPFVHYGTKYMAPRPFIEEGIQGSASEIEKKAAEYGAKLFDKVGRG